MAFDSTADFLARTTALLEDQALEREKISNTRPLPLARYPATTIRRVRDTLADTFVCAPWGSQTEPSGLLAEDARISMNHVGSQHAAARS